MTGRLHSSVGLNPDGPVDQRIGLIRIDKEDGSPLALITNYAIHETVLGGQTLLISGDAPGIALNCHLIRYDRVRRF